MNTKSLLVTGSMKNEIKMQKVNSRCKTRTRGTFTALGLALVALAGCSRNPVVLSGDEAGARTALSTVLDAWQAGQKTNQLQSARPAVHVADEDWQAGKALKAYQVSGTPLRAGGHWRVCAVLTLSDDKRPDHQKNVAYAVTVQPEITIVRTDDVPE